MTSSRAKQGIPSTEWVTKSPAEEAWGETERKTRSHISHKKTHEAAGPGRPLTVWTRLEGSRENQRVRPIRGPGASDGLKRRRRLREPWVHPPVAFEKRRVLGPCVSVLVISRCVLTEVYASNHRRDEETEGFITPESSWSPRSQRRRRSPALCSCR